MIRTCLLVSDDPDDHVEFAEALQEIPGNIVLVVVMDPEKAIQLVARKRIVPDLLIVDVSVSDFDFKEFFEAIQNDPSLRPVPVLAYGEFADLTTKGHPRISIFLHNDFSYSALRKALAEIIPW
jgi:CheY-like chemotaxis protein